MTRRTLRPLALASAAALTLGLAGPAQALSCTVSLFFDFGSAQLSSENRSVLDRIAGDYRHAFVSVAGFGDAPGSEFDNLVISRKRAETVTAYLVDRGKRNILGTGGRAQNRLVEADHGPNRRNRRVELYISPCSPEVFAAGS